MAYRDLLIYADVSKYVRSETAADLPQIDGGDKCYNEITLRKDQISFLDLHDNYKIVAIQEIGNSMSAIVLEDLITRQIRFLRMHYIEDQSKSKRRLKLL